MPEITEREKQLGEFIGILIRRIQLDDAYIRAMNEISKNIDAVNSWYNHEFSKIEYGRVFDYADLVSEVNPDLKFKEPEKELVKIEDAHK